MQKLIIKKTNKNWYLCLLILLQFVFLAFFISGFYTSILVTIESSIVFSIFLFLIVFYVIKKYSLNFWLLILGVGLIIISLFGEVFLLYYRYQWYDIVLHICFPMYITFLIYLLFATIYDTKLSIIQLLVFTFFCSIALAAIWEIVEYFVDCIFKQNMQKFIPADPFFNGGDSSKPLNGSDQEIANFYRFPKGYAFALRDTMEDIICHFSAALLSCIMIFFCCSKKNRTKTNSI